MTEVTLENGERVGNRGWRVTLAGMGINLALGILYTWSVISKEIPAEWGWTETGKSWPYAIACLVFSIVMVPAGRLQDKIGPRWVATSGGLLVGAGMVLASRTTSTLGYILGFGLLAGAGIGFGYASATPPAVKWFPAARTGLIAGIVVSGFGLASVYAAPLTRWLIKSYGIESAVMFLGIAFLAVVVVLSQALLAPPARVKFEASAPNGALGAARPQAAPDDFAPSETLRTGVFYALWFAYACGAGAGLMIIAKLAKIAQAQMSISWGFVLVAALAIGNGGGRIIAGIVSDKIGRKTTLFVCFILQAILMILLSRINNGDSFATMRAMTVVSALIGANYGANLSLFPSLTKDYYGLKNFGVNYGLVFTAWGVGGFVLPMLAGRIYDQRHSFLLAYYIASALLVVAAATTLCLKPPRKTEALAEEPAY